MKKIYSIEVVIALYFITVFIYLFHAVESNALWNSWYYLQYHIPIMVFLIELNRQKKYDRYLLWSAIVFNGEYAFLNISLANKDYITYYNYCTSKNFTLVFAASLILLVLIVNFANRNE